MSHPTVARCVCHSRFSIFVVMIIIFTSSRTECPSKKSHRPFPSQFSHELVLPKVSYERLVALLLQSVQDELHMATGLVAMLDALLTDRLHTELTDRDLVALTLVRNFQPKRKTVSALRLLVNAELTPDGTHTAATLFRGNSLASKTVDQFMNGCVFGFFE